MDELVGSETFAYDSKSSSVIRLSNGMVLYLREVHVLPLKFMCPVAVSRRGLTQPPRSQVNSYLALVCLLRSENLEKRGLIDYNINCFKDALAKVFESDAPGSGQGAEVPPPPP